MPPPSELVRYRQILNRNRILLATVMTRAFDALDGYDEDQIPGYSETIAPYVTAAETGTVAAATAYTALVLGIPTPATQVVTVPLRVRDPFTSLWHGLTEGRPFTEALDAGRSAAQAVGANHVQSIARRSGDQIADAAGLKIRWRREAEPGACSWCRVRDGNTYRTAASADFGHSRCYCDVVPAT